MPAYGLSEGPGVQVPRVRSWFQVVSVFIHLFIVVCTGELEFMMPRRQQHAAASKNPTAEHEKYHKMRFCQS